MNQQLSKVTTLNQDSTPPNPRSFPHGSQEALDSRKRPCRSRLQHGLEPEAPWQRLPLRLPSGRAVSCTRYTRSHPSPARKASFIFTPNEEIRF